MDKSSGQANAADVVAREASRAFDRELFIGIGINVAAGIFATLILDGGRTARMYVPFCVAHFSVSLLMWLRAKRNGMQWTMLDRLVLRLGPPIGLFLAAMIATPR